MGVPKLIKDPKHKPLYDFESLELWTGVDPLFNTSVDFPWGEIFARLDGPEPRDESFGRAADALHELLVWAVQGRSLSRVGLRCGFLAEAFAPELLGPKVVAQLKRARTIGERQRAATLN